MKEFSKNGEISALRPIASFREFRFRLSVLFQQFSFRLLSVLFPQVLFQCYFAFLSITFVFHFSFISIVRAPLVPRNAYELYAAMHLPTNCDKTLAIDAVSYNIFCGAFTI